MASALQSERLAELGIEESQTLKPDQVGAYLIKPDEARGIAAVEQLRVDEEGVPEDEMALVAEELANQRADIII